MTPYGSVPWLRRVAPLVVLFATIAVATHILAFESKPETSKKATIAPQIVRYHLDDPHTRAGFEYFYNQDYKRAIQEFEAALAAHPNDAFAVNHLLSGVMFQELYRIGALDSELYAKEGFLTSKQYPVDAKLKERIKELMERALQLSEEKLKANSSDA